MCGMCPQIQYGRAADSCGSRTREGQDKTSEDHRLRSEDCIRASPMLSCRRPGSYPAFPQADQGGPRKRVRGGRAEADPPAVDPRLVPCSSSPGGLHGSVGVADINNPILFFRPYTARASLLAPNPHLPRSHPSPLPPPSPPPRPLLLSIPRLAPPSTQGPTIYWTRHSAKTLRHHGAFVSELLSLSLRSAVSPVVRRPLPTAGS